MPATEDPTVYVDLIEDEPMTLAEYRDATVRYPEFDIHALEAEYRTYVSRFQPWRLLIESGDNFEPLFRSTESYLHRVDAIHAAELAFGSGSNVYLREAEQGNQVLRMATG